MNQDVSIIKATIETTNQLAQQVYISDMGRLTEYVSCKTTPPPTLLALPHVLF